MFQTFLRYDPLCKTKPNAKIFNEASTQNIPKKYASVSSCNKQKITRLVMCFRVKVDLALVYSFTRSTRAILRFNECSKFENLIFFYIWYEYVVEQMDHPMEGNNRHP